MWKKYRPKSTIPPAIGVPSMSMCFSGRCQPRGRTTTRGQFPGRAQLVLLALRGGEVDPALQRIGEVQLALDHVAPGRGGGVLHVREPHLGAGVQRVDGHLLVHRPGDFHAAVLQARGRGSDAPVRVVADGLGLAQEPRVLALGDLLAAFLPCLQQLPTAPCRGLVQLGNKRQRVRREDLALPANRLRGQRDPVDSEVVSEAVHFNLSLEKQKFDGGSVTCAEADGAGCSGSVRKRGPVAGPAELGEGGGGHGE